MNSPAPAVLFDIDGTLVDSTYHHAVAWQRAFAGQDLTTPPMWQLHRAIGMGGDKLVAHVADSQTEKDHGDALRDAWREEYLELRAEVQALRGAPELLRQLRSAGVRVALASSGEPQFAQESVDLLGVGSLIEVMTTTKDVTQSKPEPDLIGETLNRMEGVQRAVFVGDTVYDVEAAIRAGLGCVAVRSGGFGREELLAAGASLVVDGPGDLMDLVWEDHLRQLDPAATAG